MPLSSSTGLWLAPALIALCAAGARAQDSDNSLNLHHTYLPNDDQGFYVVEGARTLTQGEVYLSFDYNHTQNPLELGFPGDSRARSVVRQLQMLDVNLGVGIVDGLSVSLTLPIVLDIDGTRRLGANFAGATGSSGVGALRASLEWTFFDTRPRDDPHGLRPFRREAVQDEEAEQDWHPENGKRAPERAFELALSLKPFLTFPTGRDVDYLSDQENPTGGATLQVEVEVLRRLRLGTSFGLEAVSSSIDIGDLEIEDRFRFGLAAEFLILRARQDLVLTTFGPGPREDAGEQRRAYRALAIVAGIGGTLPAERALLDEFAAETDLDPETQASLERALDPQALSALEPLAAPLERARLAEALHQLVYADGLLDPREQAACDSMSLGDGTPDLSQPPEQTWQARVEARAPRPAPLEPVLEAGSHHTLGVGVELFGWTDTGAPFHNERKRPMEVSGYLRYSHRGLGLNLRAGISTGLTNGIGAPDVRYLLGIGWSF